MISLIVAICLSASANATEPDKVKHFVGSALISSAAYATYVSAEVRHPRTAAFLTALAVGLAKECADPKFDMHDIGADALGASLPLILTFDF